MFHTITTAATYYLGISSLGNDSYNADEANSGVEGNTGHYALKGFFAETLPDLSMHYDKSWIDHVVVTKDPSGTISGNGITSADTVYVNYKFTNSGYATANTAGVVNRITITGPNGYSQSKDFNMSALEPGEFQTLAQNVAWGKLAAGTYTITVTLDVNNVLSELTQPEEGDNNTAAWEFTIDEAAPAYNTNDWDKLAAIGLSEEQIKDTDIAQWRPVGEEIRLHSLVVYGKNLTGALDLSGCTELAYLECYDNQLTSLDVSECTSLEYLNCADNLFASLNLGNTVFAGYSGEPALSDYNNISDITEYTYTYPGGATRTLIADTTTKIVFNTTVALENFSVAQPTCDATGAVTLTWSELGSDFYYRVSKAGRIVGDYDAATYTDILAEGEIGSYTVIAMRKGSKDQSDAITVVAWSPSVQALDNIQVAKVNGGEHVQLTWTAQSDMTYTVYRAGRIVSMPNFSGGTWTDTEPFSTVSNLYHIVARYKDDNGDTQITYSNTYTVKMSQPSVSPASVRDEFWTRYGQTQEDLLTLDM